MSPAVAAPSHPLTSGSIKYTDLEAGLDRAQLDLIALERELEATDTDDAAALERLHEKITDLRLDVEDYAKLALLFTAGRRKASSFPTITDYWRQRAAAISEAVGMNHRTGDPIVSFEEAYERFVLLDEGGFASPRFGAVTLIQLHRREKVWSGPLRRAYLEATESGKLSAHRVASRMGYLRPKHGRTLGDVTRLRRYLGIDFFPGRVTDGVDQPPTLSSTVDYVGAVRLAGILSLDLTALGL